MANRIRYSFSLLFIIAMCFQPVFLKAQTRCFTNEVHQKKMLEDASYKKRFLEIEKFDVLSVQRLSSSADTSIIIPVIIHVLYNNDEENISDEQIQSQIDVLNEDFAANNATSLDVPAVWSGLVKDSKIRFQLAQRDPAGNNTSGVQRVQSTKIEYAIFDPAIYSSSLGGADAWPRNQYLNIWVCNLEGNALGFANFPGSNANQDGVVINYSAFGRNGIAKAPYNFGRTSTHEIGHWLILSHIWGDDNSDCSARDFPITMQAIDDTPNQAGPNFRCPKFPKLDDCSMSSPGIMYMNYMDYTDDKCMMFYTPGQVFRMRATLNGIRDSIRQTNGHVLANLYVHDLAIDSIMNPIRIAGEKCLEPEVRIRNNGADTIHSFRLNYGLVQGLNKFYDWSGTLLPGVSISLTLPKIGVNAGNVVMEFRLEGEDDVHINNYRSSGFKVNNAGDANCVATNMVAYPNPVTSQNGICIRSGNAQSQLSQVRIFNAMGQMLSEKKMMVNPGDAIPLDLHGFYAGVYFLSIEGDLFSENVRFIYLPGAEAANAPINCN